MASSGCAWTGEGGVGPLNIDYTRAYHCSVAEQGWLYYPLLLCWGCFLTYLLGHTADAYFSPTLAIICDKLKLTYDVAGVTFLALGNGAPDVFSSIAAFSSDDDSVVLIGICELLGASVFVTTVVVGAVAILHPTKVRPQAFIRDIVFQILANLLLTVSAIYGRVNTALALLYLLVYLIYVIVVLTLDRAERRRQRGHSLGLGGEGEEGGIGAMAAFWFTPADLLQFSKQAEGGVVGPHKRSHDFLLLDDDADEDPSEAGIGKWGENGTPHATGPSGPPTFRHTLFSQYFMAEEDGEGRGVDGRSLLSAHGGDSGNGRRYGKLRPLSTTTANDAAYALPEGGDEGLLGGSSQTTGGEGGPSNDVTGGNGGKPDSQTHTDAHTRLVTKRQASTFWDGVYWQHWRWRRRMKRQIRHSAGDWQAKGWVAKCFNILELPFIVARNLTIPSVEEESWSRLNATMQPLLAPLFLLFAGGFMSARVGSSVMPVWALVELLCGLLAVAVHLTTHESRPPSGAYGLVFTAAGFLMCSAWIYCIASELVAVIEALGTLWKLPSSLLGLTLLAWGNSVGDLITNIAVARAGLSDMAVAGCFAGPTFNLLVGLGLSFLWRCWKVRGSFELHLDQRAYVSLTFLYMGLGISLGVAFFSGFQLRRPLALALIGLYALCTIIQIIFLVHERTSHVKG